MASNVMAGERRAYSIAEVAHQHGVSKGLVQLEIKRGCLKAIRLGRRVLIPSESIRQWWSGKSK